MQEFTYKYIFFEPHIGLRSILKNFLRMLLFWLPLVNALFTFALGGLDSFLISFSVSYTIGLVTFCFCFFGSITLLRLKSFIFERKSLRVPEASGLSGITLSLLFMVPGLHFGFKAATVVAEVFGERFNEPDFSDYRLAIVFGMFIAGLFFIIDMLREAHFSRKDSALKIKQLENENLKSQVANLRSQMNPHLFFNSLNTIAATIHEQPDTAEEMVVRLAELYRVILKSTKTEFHSLKDELDLCDGYLKIEKIRFGERLNYQVNNGFSKEAEHIKVPALILQPIVENAVKYGVSPFDQGGAIEVKFDLRDNNVYIEVNNSTRGQVDLSSHKGSGTALNNCKSRIQLIYRNLGSFKLVENMNQTSAFLSFPLESM